MIPKNPQSQTIGQSIGMASQGSGLGGPGEASGPVQQEIPFNESSQAVPDWLKKILDTPTGKGSVESYDEHPLNFTRTRGMSHILRGISGFLGNLDRAIIDIGVGLTREIYDKFFKKGIKEPARTGGATSRNGETPSGEAQIL